MSDTFQLPNNNRISQSWRRFIHSSVDRRLARISDAMAFSSNAAPLGVVSHVGWVKPEVSQAITIYQYPTIVDI